MASVEYTVDLVDGAWTVGLGEKRFGPYSTLDRAVAAAVAAADKAETQGYEALVTINTVPEPAGEAASQADSA